MSEKEKKDNIKKVNGIFEMNVKSGSNEATYTIDLKKVRRLPLPHAGLAERPADSLARFPQEGKVYKGPAKPKADGPSPRRTLSTAESSS